MGRAGKKLMTNGIKHAVILSGGGAYGAFEVGVLKSIVTNQIGGGRFPQIVPSIYTGTSVGAVNAAVMVSQDGLGVPAAEAIEFLENAWLNLIANSAETCGNGRSEERRVGKEGRCRWVGW